MNIVLPGSYAWFTTVAWPAVTGGAPVSAKAASGVALLMLLWGAKLAAAAHRMAAPVGIVGFFAGCVVVWQLAGRQLSGAAIDPFGATLGGIGWVLFVLGWGSARPSPSTGNDPRNGEELPRELRPRGGLARGSGAILGLAVAAACVLLYLGWRVVSPAHALLGRTVALVSSVGLVVAATQIAVERGRPRTRVSAGDRLASSVRNLTTAVLLLALGVLWSLMGST
jgi:hypothetical protein